MRSAIPALSLLLGVALLVGQMFSPGANAALSTLQGDPGPQATTGRTSTLVAYRNGLDVDMAFSVTTANPTATLTARFQMPGTSEPCEVGIEVKPNSTSRREATKQLEAAIKAKLPPADREKVRSAGATLVISGTIGGPTIGTPESSIEHDNFGGNVNKNKPRTIQSFQS